MFEETYGCTNSNTLTLTLTQTPNLNPEEKTLNSYVYKSEHVHRTLHVFDIPGMSLTYRYNKQKTSFDIPPSTSKAEEVCYTSLTYTDLNKEKFLRASLTLQQLRPSQSAFNLYMKYCQKLFDM